MSFLERKRLITNKLIEKMVKCPNLRVLKFTEVEGNLNYYKIFDELRRNKQNLKKINFFFFFLKHNFFFLTKKKKKNGKYFSKQSIDTIDTSTSYFLLQ